MVQGSQNSDRIESLLLLNCTMTELSYFYTLQPKTLWVTVCGGNNTTHVWSLIRLIKHGCMSTSCARQALWIFILWAIQWMAVNPTTTENERTHNTDMENGKQIHCIPQIRKCFYKVNTHKKWISQCAASHNCSWQIVLQHTQPSNSCIATI